MSILQIILGGYKLGTRRSETVPEQMCAFSHTPLLSPVCAGKQMDVAAGLLCKGLRIKVLETTPLLWYQVGNTHQGPSAVFVHQVN